MLSSYNQLYVKIAHNMILLFKWSGSTREVGMMEKI